MTITANANVRIKLRLKSFAVASEGKLRLLLESFSRFPSLMSRVLTQIISKPVLLVRRLRFVYAALVLRATY